MNDYLFGGKGTLILNTQEENKRVLSPNPVQTWAKCHRLQIKLNLCPTMIVIKL